MKMPLQAELPQTALNVAVTIFFDHRVMMPSMFELLPMFLTERPRRSRKRAKKKCGGQPPADL